MQPLVGAQQLVNMVLIHFHVTSLQQAVWPMIYGIGEWQVPTANSDRHREIIVAIYNNIKSNRAAKFPYLDSSKLYEMADGSTDLEDWIYVDAFTDEDNYKKMSKALLEDERATSLRKIWESLILPSSFRKELWRDAVPQAWIT